MYLVLISLYDFLSVMHSIFSLPIAFSFWRHKYEKSHQHWPGKCNIFSKSSRVTTGNSQYSTLSSTFCRILCLVANHVRAVITSKLRVTLVSNLYFFAVYVVVNEWVELYNMHDAIYDVFI